MEIEYFGANCVRLSSKKATLVFDDNLTQLGSKSVTKPGDVAIFGVAYKNPKAAKLVIDQPGEYEVSNVSIQGIAARGHTEEPGQLGATMFKVILDDIRVATTGHIYPELTDAQLEALGMVDILFIPVGGNGYTLDAMGALSVIKKIEPKVVIPTNYADKGLKYEVPQQSLDDAIKGLAMEPKERLSKLKLKASDLVGTEGTQLIILERQ